MDRRSFRASLKRAFELADALGLDPIPVTSVELPVEERYREELLNPERSYQEIYLVGLELKQYNFILADESYFQFSFFENRKGVELRLAYLPNPFKKVLREPLIDLHPEGGLDEASLELVDDGPDTVADALEADEDDFGLDFEFVPASELEPQLASQEIDAGVPVIRYDFSPQQYKQHAHPAGHLHIGFNSPGRWPVAHILSPLAFTQLILRHKVPDQWFELDPNLRQFGGYPNEKTYAAERAELKKLPVELFSASEAQIFHLV
jgi:hypothetical protein